jgi:membrane dipeptidase
MSMDRRQLLIGGLATPLAASAATGALAEGSTYYIGDMHYHLFFQGRRPASSYPLAKTMAGGNATLVAWSLVGDLLWMGATPRGFKQKSVPKAGETVSWFQRELARIKGHIAEQNLKIVRGPEDVDLALKGEPHVVLAVEGASFLDDDLGQVQAAYDLGIRHIQIVHYIRNAIGDFQTEKPEHQGLTEFGKKVIEECNRLGILVDLAHSTAQAQAQALAISRVPVVWSHSSVTRTRNPQWTLPAWQARQLSLEGAKAIAAKGGVVGLWALRTDVGATPEAYADRLAEMADWLGEDHAAFGTDMNGLLGPVLADYADARRVVERWQRRGIGESRIRKIAIENYARVLRQAMAARS